MVSERPPDVEFEPTGPIMSSPSSVCACLLLLAVLAVPSVGAAAGREANTSVAVPADGGTLRQESTPSSADEAETPSADEAKDVPEATPESAADGESSDKEPK